MRDIITILSCVTYVSVYLLACRWFVGDWKQVVDLPDLPRTDVPCIGITEHGGLYHNFWKFPHMIVAGSTGYGKTNFIKSLISQVNGEIILIDLKGGDDYGKCTAIDISRARIELERVTKVLMKKKRKERVYVIVDEAGELMPPKWMKKEDKEDYYRCLIAVNQIARLGRSKNISLIYCTQYPTSDIVDKQIKQCAETKMCFRLPAQVASLVVLDEVGAEQLPSGMFGLGIYKRDSKHLVRSYKFMERDGWDAKVRTEEIERSRNIEVCEENEVCNGGVTHDYESEWFSLNE